MHETSSSDTFKYFKELSEHTSKAIFAFQVESATFSYLNSSFEQIWGKPVESIQSRPASLLETVHPEDREYLISAYHQLLEGKKKDSIEFRILVEDDKTRWLYLSNPFLIKEAHNQHVIIGMLEDRTNEKENYTVLEKFAAKKNSILEILSHDLAGPLINIQGISSLLADEIKEYKNPQIEKMVGVISKTSERSIRLIREFVQQEFMASANSPFIKKRINIVKEIEEIMNQYKGSERSVAKTFNFTTSDEEIFVEADDYKFGQVINNLISNSIKFTHDGGTISVSVEDRKGKVLITVSDNGIGIPEKYHNGLFEKFTTARRAGIKGEPSTGLGMSIIKTIIDWHNGTIRFESKENEGTTFYIELPKE